MDGNLIRKINFKVTGRDGKPLKSYKSRLEAVTGQKHRDWSDNTLPLAGTKVAARSKGGRIKWISPEKGSSINLLLPNQI